MQPSDLRERLDAVERVVDSGVGHPVPRSGRWDEQFGRGWAVGVVLSGIEFIAGGVYAASAAGGNRTRGIAVAAGSLAGGFLFATLYLLRYGIGIGWQAEVIWPDERPILYRVVTGTLASLAAIGVAAAAWWFFHADAA